MTGKFITVDALINVTISHLRRLEKRFVVLVKQNFLRANGLIPFLPKRLSEYSQRQGLILRAVP